MINGCKGEIAWKPLQHTEMVWLCMLIANCSHCSFTIVYNNQDTSIHCRTRVKPSACCAVFFLLQLPLVRLYNMSPMRLCVKLRSHCETLPSDTNFGNHERFILFYMVKSLKIVQYVPGLKC